MLKKRSKAMAIVLTSIFCLSFVVPAFITPDAAQASSTYEVLKAPSVKTTNVAQDLGVVKVTLSDTTLAVYDTLTVSLPSDIEVADKVKVTDSLDSAYKGIKIVANNSGDCLSVGAFKETEFDIKSNNNFDIVMAGSIPTNGDTVDQFFYIYFNGINLKNTTGDIEVDFEAPSSSSFTSSKGIVIAKASSSGSTTTTIKKVEDISDKGSTINTITVAEDAAGSFDFAKDSGEITLEILTKGFSWEKTGMINGEWAFSGSKGPEKVIGNNDEKLVFGLPDAMYTIDGDTKIPKKFNTPGKFTFSDLRIKVDSSKATIGDEIEVKVKGCGMDKADLLVARYSADKNLQGTVGLQNSQDSSGVRLSLYQGSSLIAQTTSCADGSYSFSNIKPGTYSIQAQKSNWLSTKIEGINVNPGTTTIVQPLSLFFGDLNNDGIVDLFDLVILSQNYGKSAL